MSATTIDHGISPEAYQFIADMVYEHSRIRLGPDKQALVTGRLTKRLRHLKLDTFEEYCAYLQSPGGAPELGPLVDLISTNHTNFFREIQHMEFLRDHILPEWLPRVVKSRNPLRVWSAACSSGEEPYTIAIVLAEYARQHGALAWQIEASDISSRVLEHAQKGMYDVDRVKVPEPEWLPRYFQKGTGNYEGFYRVKDSLRQSVKFHRLNLFEPNYPVAASQHVIFCRNVMIYFDTATQQELVTRLIGQLATGGYMIVGHSESLLGVRHSLKTIKPGIYVKG
jgi:chemotaxis protein methyltransferase CheR